MSIDPYSSVLKEFNKKRVKYVVVGMSGINYYARQARDVFATQDYDIFVKPVMENVKKAVSILKDKKFTVVADKEEFEEARLKEVVRDRKTVLAVNDLGIMIELILAVSGFVFDQMAKDAVIFNVGKTPIKVGNIKKLIASKKIAGRKKDRIFLKRFEAFLREEKDS
jgi:predicted nucleotidyltransferase